MKKNDQEHHFNIGHAVKHFNNFRETSDIEELKKCNQLLETHIRYLESLKKGD